MNIMEENEMENSKDLKYTKEHEWIKVENDIGTVGITDFAQDALTDVVFVELPKIGKKVEKFKTAATIESVKSVSDIFAPVSGEIAEVNQQLAEHPEFVNKEPYGNGWIFKIKITDKNELDNLMSSEEYEKIAKEE
ncbi:MAG: glycine cleavage system protein GcvH [Candidatus Woesearchaeota archaeon]|nr:glycine cleavage system protein GcvH [Candidatus Woesearchaeota archaeon]